MAINWKEVAHHQRHLRKLSESLEVTLKRRLWAEHDTRATLVTAMSELLPIIAGNGDPYANQCFICDHDHGHAAGCAYIRALDAVAEAGRSLESQPEPTAITFTCHHCGDFFDEPIALFLATDSKAVLAPTLCKECGHGGED